MYREFIKRLRKLTGLLRYANMMPNRDKVPFPLRDEQKKSSAING